MNRFEQQVLNVQQPLHNKSKFNLGIKMETLGMLKEKVNLLQKRIKMLQNNIEIQEKVRFSNKYSVL